MKWIDSLNSLHSFVSLYRFTLAVVSLIPLHSIKFIAAHAFRYFIPSLILHSVNHSLLVFVVIHSSIQNHYIYWIDIVTFHTVIIYSLRACHSLSFHLKKWSELSEPHEWKTVLGSLLRSVSLSAHRIRSLPPFSCSLLHSDFILHSHCLHSLNSFNFVSFCLHLFYW